MCAPLVEQHTALRREVPDQRIGDGLHIEAGGIPDMTTTSASWRITENGECAPVLWAQGNADAAIQVEHLWDEIARKHEVDILCGYVLNSFQREQESRVYEGICAEHSAVYSG